MFEYEIATMRSADLIREADAYRQIQQLAHAATATSGSHETEGRVKDGRHWFAKAA
ncbi:hypothetical protein LG634_17565 [Streptomyces bambusae]|uniref:hypothetical protein n=1 Tax=Streptomyces bambusae TaxID=1550616 RepID=UPI001CFE01BA|nr:hypothetical protein [Streptomyces bambusae]MCB5166640.1 hypothetical protein [Streptomyces bambusae]